MVSGYVTDCNYTEDTIFDDHLERVSPYQNSDWKFPRKEDECEVHIDQIIGMKPEYEWDYSNIRLNKLTLKNHEAFNLAVKSAQLRNFDE